MPISMCSPSRSFDDRRAAAILRLDERHAGALLQQLAGDVTERAVARISRGDLAGIGLRVVDKLLQRFRRKTVLGRDDDRRFAHQHDRREVALRIVRHDLVDELVVRRRPGRREQERVAVRRGFRDGRAPDIAARAGPVVDDERLAECSAQVLDKPARHDIAGDASGEWNDHRDRPRRPCLRVSIERREQPRAESECEKRCPARAHNVLRMC
jgi:hypothetical protein